MNKQVAKRIAENIKFYVENSGLKQEEIVKEIKRKGVVVNQGQISKWCSGLNIPRIDKANALAEVLGCKLEDLFKV